MSKDFGPLPLPCFLPVERFIVDEAYQRKIASQRSQKRIEKIVENFCWADFGAVYASTREGGNYALTDGHHRIEAVRRIGHDYIRNVPAILMGGMTIEAEAKSFVHVNRDRVSVDTFTLHRANVLASDARACQIDRLARETGLVIPPHQPNRKTINAGEIVCLNVLGMLLDKYDWPIAVDAVQSVATAYRDEIYGIRAPFLIVAAKLLKDGEADVTSLVAAFRQSTAADLYAQSGPPGKRNIAPSRLDRIAEILRERLELEASRRKWASETFNRPRIPIIDQAQFPDDNWSIAPPTRDQLMGRR